MSGEAYTNGAMLEMVSTLKEYLCNSYHELTPEQAAVAAIGFGRDLYVIELKLRMIDQFWQQHQEGNPT